MRRGKPARAGPERPGAVTPRQAHRPAGRAVWPTGRRPRRRAAGSRPRRAARIPARHGTERPSRLAIAAQSRAVSASQTATMGPHQAAAASRRRGCQPRSQATPTAPAATSDTGAAAATTPAARQPAPAPGSPPRACARATSQTQPPADHGQLPGPKRSGQHGTCWQQPDLDPGSERAERRPGVAHHRHCRRRCTGRSPCRAWPGVRAPRRPRPGNRSRRCGSAARA